MKKLFLEGLSILNKLELASFWFYIQSTIGSDTSRLVFFRYWQSLWFLTIVEMLRTLILAPFSRFKLAEYFLRRPGSNPSQEFFVPGFPSGLLFKRLLDLTYIFVFNFYLQDKTPVIKQSISVLVRQISDLTRPGFGYQNHNYSQVFFSFFLFLPYLSFSTRVLDFLNSFLPDLSILSENKKLLVCTSITSIFLLMEVFDFRTRLLLNFNRLMMKALNKGLEQLELKDFNLLKNYLDPDYDYTF